MTQGSQDKLDVSLLRQAYGETLLRDSGECPGEDVLAALVTGGITGEERRKVADHIVVCRRCSADYRTLTRLDQAAPAVGSQPSVKWPMALAAALGLLALGAVPIWKSWTPGTSGWAPIGEDVRRSGSAVSVSPAPSSQLPEPPRELGWPMQVGATGYRVRVFDLRAELVWESEMGSEATVRLPPELFESPSESSYFWVVEVMGPVERTRLGPFEFHLQGLRE